MVCGESFEFLFGTGKIRVPIFESHTLANNFWKCEKLDIEKNIKQSYIKVTTCNEIKLRIGFSNIHVLQQLGAQKLTNFWRITAENQIQCQQW